MRLTWIWVVIATWLIGGCGYFKQVEETSVADDEQMTALRAAVPGKLAEYLAVADRVTGWPDPNDCDGVLHAGVARAAGVKEVKISLAESEPGKIGRRAAPSPCWTVADGDVGSKSETSGDMAVGYLLALWRDGDLAGVQRFANYGQANEVRILGLPAWVLGQPYPEQDQRVVLRPGMVGIVGRMIYRLSGQSDDRSYRDIPNLYSSGGQDYQRRLTALGIVLGGEVDRGVSEVDVEVLWKLVEIDPKDPLFQAAYARYSGEYAPAYGVLLGEVLVCPTYGRGSLGNCLANWLFAASLIVGDVSGVKP